MSYASSRKKDLRREQKYLCVLYKAFDRVNWIILVKILKDIDIDCKDRRMNKKLSVGQTMVVRFDG